MSFRRTLAAVTLTLTLVSGATGCGGDDEAAGPAELSATEHNEADVAFATEMMQHHAEALVMADLTMDRPLAPRVEQLVEEIRASQVAEIETFADWLSDWDEEIPETVRDHANAGHGPATMPGSEELTGASDEEFQDLWLQLMVEHHEGALELARSEQQDGRYRPAVELAATIEQEQSAQIETMQQLVGG